jgi:probable phosphoglycerate mutase
MAIFLLIRHGENDWVGKRLAGRTPQVHLNANGIKQAKAISELLSPLPFNAIYSSPLERAMETAQPLAEKLSLPINIQNGLQEIDFGNWQGKTIKQLRRLKLWNTVQNNPEAMAFPAGESFIEAQNRLAACLMELNKQHSEKDLVACFSHSDSIRLLVAHFLNMPLNAFQRISIDTTSISTIMISDTHIHVPTINLIPTDQFVKQYSKILNKKEPK